MGVLRSLRSYSFVAILLFLVLFPLFWVISASFKPSFEWFSRPPVWITSHPTLANYEAIFASQQNINAIVHSVIVATAGTILAVAIGYPAAYSISRGVGARRFLMFMALIPRATPPMVLAIPLLIFYSSIGFMDSLHGLTLIYAAVTVFFVIWMTKPFIDSIPRTIEEAALLDGVSRYQIPFRIVFPLVRGGLAATAVLVFILNWSEFLFALILTRVDARTVPVQLVTISAFGATPMNEGALAALSSLMIIPFFAGVYFLLKYLLKGFSFGVLAR